jgi:hypothetical protein
MKNANEKRARIIRRLELQLEILETQMKLWELRAKAKRSRIAEVQREIQERRR